MSMKVIVSQKEENGIYSIGLKTSLEDITFGCEHTMSMNKTDGRPYSRSQIETTIGNCVEDFIKRYDQEKERIAGKVVEQNTIY